MLRVLRERQFPAREIVAFATARSAGQEVEGHVVQELADESQIEGFDIALLSAGAAVSRQWGPRFVAAGATVIDNSSAFRREPQIPLVVAEVNPGLLSGYRGLIANPNCSTMQMVVALAPIHRAVGIERLVVATYQSVSGTGKEAVDELETQAHASLHGMEMPPPEVYPEPIAFNVIGAAGSFPAGDDHTDEERKMMFETRKILKDDSIGVAVTDVPTPLRSADRDEVFVGRIRDDETHPRALSMWIVSDNLRKGAATNAVQIAELLIGAEPQAQEVAGRAL
jgi:aspartate-semialdehyde dehydrogenase